MKQLSIFWLITSFLVLTGCSTPKYNDLAGNLTITGKAMFFDSLSGSYTPNPLSSLTVYISDSADSNNYLYTSKSDLLGNYIFTGFDSLHAYIVHAKIDSNQEFYSGRIFYHTGVIPFLSQGGDTLYLTPDQQLQNGLFIEVTDAKGGRLANSLVYVFASSVLAGTQDTAGATFRLKTDSYGRCLELNIGYGPYTVLGYYFDAQDTLKGTTSAPLQVNIAGITSSSLVLQ